MKLYLLVALAASATLVSSLEATVDETAVSVEEVAKHLSIEEDCDYDVEDCEEEDYVKKGMPGRVPRKRRTKGPVKPKRTTRRPRPPGQVNGHWTARVTQRPKMTTPRHPRTTRRTIGNGRPTHCRRGNCRPAEPRPPTVNGRPPRGIDFDKLAAILGNAAEITNNIARITEAVTSCPPATELQGMWCVARQLNPACPEEDAEDLEGVDESCQDTIGQIHEGYSYEEEA